MEERRAELAMDEREDGQFVLSKTDPSGLTQEIVLSDTEVMFLARLAPSFARQLGTSKSPAGSDISALLAVPVVDFSIGSDLHEQVVILRLLDEAEGTTDFSMHPTMANNIGKSLIAWSEKIGYAHPAQH